MSSIDEKHYFSSDPWFEGFSVAIYWWTRKPQGGPNKIYTRQKF